MVSYFYQNEANEKHRIKPGKESLMLNVMTAYTGFKRPRNCSKISPKSYFYSLFPPFDMLLRYKSGGKKCKRR